MTLHCPSCQGANLPEHRFCTLCGTPLVLSEVDRDCPLPPARLVAIHEPEVVEEVPISSSVVFLGRDPANEVVVPSERASLRHARIFYREGGYWIEDLGSTNGTQLDGEALREPRPLRHGTLIKIGSSILKFLAGPE